MKRSQGKPSNLRLGYRASISQVLRILLFALNQKKREIYQTDNRSNDDIRARLFLRWKASRVCAHLVRTLDETLKYVSCDDRRRVERRVHKHSVALYLERVEDLAVKCLARRL